MNKVTTNQLTKIAQEHGTPVYVYDRQKMEEKYLKLSDAFKNQKVKIYYACKALSNINILKIFNKIGAGLDTVSINEVHLGLKAGFELKNIVFTPNCVDFEEIKQAVALGVHINIDNISILEQFGNLYGNSYPIMIRFNPHILAGGNFNISTGHIDSKFGISIHQLRHVIRIVKTTQIRVEGLHMHTGSEIKDIEVFIQGLEVMLNIVTQFEDVKYLDLGSGFKVPYQAEDKETDVKLLASKLESKLLEFQKEENRTLEIWFEPGKYLVSESGYFITKANVIKPTPATVFVGINSGFHHLIRPMFYNSYHYIENISNPKGTERIYTIVGHLCETDTFAWDRVLNEVNEGDLIVFHNAGAYCYEMSMNYNSRCKPAEILIDHDKISLIRTAETPEELLRNVVEVVL